MAKKWHGTSPHDENLIKKGNNRTKYQTFLWDKKGVCCLNIFVNLEIENCDIFWLNWN